MIRSKKKFQAYSLLLALVSSGCLLTTLSSRADLPSDEGAPCLAEVEGQCVLSAVYQRLEMTSESDSNLTVTVKSVTRNRQAPPITFTLAKDLETRVRTGELTAEDGALIGRELAEFDGVVYTIPPFEVVATTLGFPDDAALAAEDYAEFIRVHLQLVLTISPMTSAYLCERMKVVGTEEIDSFETVNEAKPEPGGGPKTVPGAQPAANR